MRFSYLQLSVPNRAVPWATLRKRISRFFDNGKAQAISGFSIQKREGVESDARPAPAPVFPNATPPPPIVPGRFIVFLFDDMHLSVEDLGQAQKAAANMLASITDADMAAIVSMSGKVNSGLTSDHAQLQAAIMKLQVQNVYRTTGSECPPMDYYQADLIQNKHNSNALEAAIQEVMTCSPGIPLRQIAERLAEAAATQALLVGDQDVQVSFAAIKTYLRRMLGPARPAHFDSGVTRLPHSHEQSAFRRIGDHGYRSRVQCHHQHAGCPRPICQRSRGQRTRWHSPFSTRLKSENRRDSMSLNENIMAELAAATGGTYFHNSNDLEGGFKRLAEAPEYLYLLAFSIGDMKQNGSHHRLKVKVDQDGLSSAITSRILRPESFEEEEIEHRRLQKCAIQGSIMQLQRVIAALTLSLLLSPQLLTQTLTQAPSSGSSAAQTSGTPHSDASKAKCTDNGTYINSKGQTVPRPENCSAAPKGATAQCRDGTYSFSKSRRGTCSHHGGVAKWL